MQLKKQETREATRSLKLLVLGVATLAICSCAETTSVKSLPLEEKFTPVFANESNAENPTTEAASTLAFLDSSFFLGASVNFEEAFASEKLKAVKWNELERSLGKWLGPQNAELKNIRRIWFLVDHSFADLMSPDANKKPMDAMAFVVELKTKVDDSFLKRLPNQKAPLAAGSPAKLANSELQVAPIDDHHFVIANKNLVQRLQGKTNSGKLRLMANEKSLARTISIFADPKPLSGLLNTVAQVGKSFGAADATQPFLAIDQIEISGDLADEDLFRFTVSADDGKAIDELASQLSNGMSSSGGGSGGSAFGGMLGGGLGGGGGFGGPRRGAQLYEFASSKSVTAFIEDVQKNSLAETVKSDKRVDLTVKKTDTFDALLVDLINDLQALISQTQRTSNLAAIAKAIGEFEKKNGTLPRDAALGPNPTTDPKFSWRVAILPQLGLQSLYDRIDFSQAWNSEANRKVAAEMPDVFANTAEPAKTSLSITKGDRFVYTSSADGPKLESIVDPRNRTAIVVELAPTRAIDWMAPDESLATPIRADDFGMPNEDGFLFIDAEFRPRGVRKSSSNIETVLTTNGKEKIDRQDLILIETAKETLEKLNVEGLKDE